MRRVKSADALQMLTRGGLKHLETVVLLACQENAVSLYINREMIKVS